MRRHGSYQDTWRERRRAEEIAKRLEQSVMGELPQRKDVARQIVEEVLSRAKGRPVGKLSPKELASLVEYVARETARMDLSMAQVQAAKQILDRTAATLALFEHTGQVQHSAVVRLPMMAKDSQSWKEAIDTEYRISGPAGTAEPAN